jgi:NifB/MoaA-like Fe-S oxidoreductase
LSALLDAGIDVHGQVVVCPGINDADALDDTLLGVLDRFPGLASVGVVPLGVSDHTTEPEMRSHTRAEAERVIDIVEAWQSRYLAALGRRLVYASDEYYLLAGRPFPALEYYGDLSQHENGIGMAAQFAAEVRAELAGSSPDVVGTRSGFFAWVDGAPAEGYRAPRLEAPLLGDGVPVTLTISPRRRADAVRARESVTILTGEYGARVLAPLADDLAAAAGARVDVRPVPNRFFGGNIAVTGLLTGPDVARALEEVDPSARVLLPDVVLSNGRFLDDTTPADLPRAVEVVATDGASLVQALRGSGPGR